MKKSPETIALFEAVTHLEVGKHAESLAEAKEKIALAMEKLNEVGRHLDENRKYDTIQRG